MKFTPAGPSIIHNASRYSRRLSTTAIRASPPPSDGLTLPQSDAYCQQLTKSTDYPAFLTSYFYPSLARPAWFALNAFHAEIAQVRRKVSKEILGEMRYTWWRDAVKAVIAGEPPQHPVCLALAEAHRLHRLEAYHLQRLISAYSNPLPPLPSLSDLRTQAHSTYSSILLLALGILPPSPTTGDEDLLGHGLAHIGKALGLARVLRSAGEGEGPLGRAWQGGEEAWREMVKSVTATASEELSLAREVCARLQGSKVPREKLAVFLSAVPAQVYVQRLERALLDPRLAGARADDWRTSWRVWRAWRIGRF